MKLPITSGACALLSLLFMPLSALAAPEGAGTYSDWFEVEIIVFAQQHPSPADETWPKSPDLEYPAEMVAIGPPSDDDLKPNNLSELGELLAGAGNAAQTGNDTAAQTAGGYLFADKSRFDNQPAAATPASVQDQQNEAAEAQLSAEAEQIFNAHLPRAFRALPHGDLRLGGVAHSIELSSMYRMLLHVGWLQPIPTGGPDYPVLIQGGQRYGGDFEVDGTLTVSRERYLHVDTNLWFTQFKKKYDEEAPLPEIVTNLDPAVRAKYPQLIDAAEKAGNYEAVQTYTMSMSRRMRSATLHYLDNPYFGVLIEVDEFNYTPPGGAQSPSPTSSPSK